MTDEILKYSLRLKEEELRAKIHEGLRPDEIYQCKRCKKTISFDEATIRKENYTTVHYHGFYNTLVTSNYSIRLCPHCYIHKRKVDKWFKYVFLAIFIILCIISIILIMMEIHDIIDALSSIPIISFFVYMAYLVTKNVFILIDDWVASH